MGCSSCGGNRRSRTPGGTPDNAIVLGDPDGSTAQPATFLVETDEVKKGKYKFVTGTGVDQAVEEGTIRLGFDQPTIRRKPRRNPADDPQFYVQTGRNKWVGFASESAAARYAKANSTEVLTRDQVLAAGSAS